jgi:hypothetical protein
MKYIIATGRKDNNVINEYYIIDTLKLNFEKENKEIGLTKDQLKRIYTKGEFHTGIPFSFEKSSQTFEFKKGSEVNLINGYFRTDGNKTDMDDLGNLLIIK